VTTWTPGAVSSSARHFDLSLWRGVEAQHLVSTLRLAADLESQRILEREIDAAKPPLADALAALPPLLAAPFRYRPLPPGSRFRSPEDPGVFYGAPEVRTVCAEVGHWRWRGFLLDCPGLQALPATSFTLFPVKARGEGVDLRESPFDADGKAWQDRNDYRGTQAFGRVARAAGLALIGYQSVRDPGAGLNVAVLAPSALRGYSATRHQTWTLALDRKKAIWIRSDREAFSFDLSLA
jgi:hypothetical protein